MYNNIAPEEEQHTEQQPDVTQLVEALEAALMVMTSKEVSLEKQADAITIARAALAAKPAEQDRPFHDLDPNWLYSVIRYARKAGFYPDVTEGLREMNENEAFRVPNLYAAPAVQGEPVAVVDADDDGMWADILPDVGVKVGQPLFAAQQPAPDVAWLPHLIDRADGVAGHYAIARKNPAGYREVWNLRSHHWAAFSDGVLTMDEALAILKKLEMPTAPQPTEQPISHDWDDQDKCRRCGDRDWYASATCTPKQQPAMEETMDTPDKIWLIDMGDCVAWADDPNPAGMDDDEKPDAVEYVRADTLKKCNFYYRR